MNMFLMDYNVCFHGMVQKINIKNNGGMNATTLKIIGMIAMTIDHIGYFLLPKVIGLRIIGRVAYPIFAYMIAEGCRYTKNKVRYFLSVFCTGCGCSLVSYLSEKSLYQSIFITFTCSIVLIFALQEVTTDRNSLLKKCFFGLLAMLLITLYVCLFGVKVISGLETDYGFYGILTPVLIHFGQSKSEKLSALMIGLCLISIGGMTLQIFSLAAVGILAFYNGERGKHDMKWLFYGYYPFHIAFLYAISQFI